MGSSNETRATLYDHGRSRKRLWPVRFRLLAVRGSNMMHMLKAKKLSAEMALLFWSNFCLLSPLFVFIDKANHDS